MGANEERKAWEQYVSDELRGAEPILTSLGYTLDETQVHVSGERYLMARPRDVGGGGKKLVLSGTRLSDGGRAIIKVSSDPAGQREIEREHEAREVLHTLNFARRTLFTPEEHLFTRRGKYLISITEYVPQNKPLLLRPLEEQFFLMLQALGIQEGVHATTSAHADVIRRAFGIAATDRYLSEFAQFRTASLRAVPDSPSLAQAFERASLFLQKYATDIERYCGFLTHADFVPNNLRVADHTVYLLDSASLHFGNKYEGWARLLNFMIHHNYELEQVLTRYVRENRGEEEYLVLRLMRVYKIGFLLMYYAQALERTEGPLHELTELRLSFWTDAMHAVLDDVPLSVECVGAYLEEQQKLRSEEEHARQREMIGEQ